MCTGLAPVGIVPQLGLGRWGAGCSKTGGVDTTGILKPNVELSGRQQRGALDSGRTMGRKALRSLAGAPRCWRSA